MDVQASTSLVGPVGRGTFSIVVLCTVASLANWKSLVWVKTQERTFVSSNGYGGSNIYSYGVIAGFKISCRNKSRTIQNKNYYNCYYP